MPLELMARDVGELLGDGPFGWTVLALFLMLPLAAWRLVRAGAGLAWVSVIIPVALVVAWYLYYARGWWAIEEGDSRVVLFPTLAGWAWLGFAWLLMDDHDEV
ncbi:MAG: hypothetical protein M3345_08240 [Actinomycetota bacterium]|nr:hypothetical protein [Actinomycetota bacterium]